MRKSDMNRERALRTEDREFLQRQMQRQGGSDLQMIPEVDVQAGDVLFIYNPGRVCKAPATPLGGLLGLYGVALANTREGELCRVQMQGVARVRFVDEGERFVGDKVYLSSQHPGQVTCEWSVGHSIGVYLGEDQILLSRRRNRPVEEEMTYYTPLRQGQVPEVNHGLYSYGRGVLPVTARSIHQDPPEEDREDMEACLAEMTELCRVLNLLPGLEVDSAALYDNRKHGTGVNMVFWFRADRRGMLFLAWCMDRRYYGTNWSQWSIRLCVGDSPRLPLPLSFTFENKCTNPPIILADTLVEAKEQVTRLLERNVLRLLQHENFLKAFGLEDFGEAYSSQANHPLEESYESRQS